MELRHLRYFVVLAEELHFRRAAERLMMTQPPLSQQIQQLEDELGVQLFNRTRRSVELTEAGAAFLVEARDLLARADRAAHTAQRAARGETGHLTIGFVASAAYALLPELLRRYRALYPHVALTLREIPSAEQIKALENGSIDLGIAREPPERPGIHMQIIRREPILAVLPAEHTTTPLNLADLRDEPFILFPRRLGPGLHDRILRACEGVGFQPQITQEAVHMTTIIGLVAVGMGVSLVPESVAALGREGVVYRPLDDVTLHSDIAAIWRREAVVLANFLALAR